MNNSSSGGMGFFGVLTLIFITLKLTDTIDWSWWWVLSPIWLPLVLGILILIGAVGWAAGSENQKNKRS